MKVNRSYFATLTETSSCYESNLDIFYEKGETVIENENNLGMSLSND